MREVKMAEGERMEFGVWLGDYPHIIVFKSKVVFRWNNGGSFIAKEFDSSQEAKEFYDRLKCLFQKFDK